MGDSSMDLAFIRRAFAPSASEPSVRIAPQGVSAVLLALSDSPRGPSLLYTQRAEAMRSHPGEISFPGGRIDPADESPRHAALREAHEEVGIAPNDVRVLGHLTDFLTHRDVLVCAYVAELLVDPPTVPRSFAEVAHVFSVPIETLLDPARHEARAIQGMGRSGTVHYWHVGGRTIWGITGEITARFLSHVYGWTPAAPARIITSLADFQP